MTVMGLFHALWVSACPAGLRHFTDFHPLVVTDQRLQHEQNRMERRRPDSSDLLGKGRSSVREDLSRGFRLLGRKLPDRNR
jgi:hypothetical protein